jgi:transposase-like protein
MEQERSPGKPTTRRYSEAEKERAVRAVRQLRKELGHDHGTIGRVAEQLGIGTDAATAAQPTPQGRQTVADGLHNLRRQ